MNLEYAENLVDLMANIIALMVCLFQYINNKSRAVMYATVIFVCALMSGYYWTVYLFIMGDTPDVSNLFSYSGWNIAYFLIILMLLHMKSPEEKRFFSPLMLLPVPFNIWQLSLYVPFGGVLNSIYQVTAMTVVMSLCIQSFIHYGKNRADHPYPPYVPISTFAIAVFSFGMWTTSCFDEPVGDLYYPFSFLQSISYLLMAISVVSTDRASRSNDDSHSDILKARFRTLLKAGFSAFVFLCCSGGALLASWMRDVMETGAGSETGINKVIPVVLFVISLFLSASALAIIAFVDFAEKVAENNELRDARQVAERSNAAKSEFLANMSHEIRTPINAILGMNEIIMRESLQARDFLPQDRSTLSGIFGDICIYAGNIESAGKSLLSIINDILDFSKIESGKMELTNAEYRLSSVLNDVSNMIIFKARAKDLDFGISVDESLPDSLMGDEVRVRQIITNLLNNAVKYTDHGSISMSVGFENSNDVTEGSVITLTVSVTDTGIGIREEDMARLFSKFERMELDRNSAVEGTGLGLAITRSLLTLMGGGIEVESVHGKGSTFTARIPQTVVRCEPVGNFREKFEKSIRSTRVRHAAFRAPDARILIVDDTAMNLKVAVGLLKKTQIRIDTATSGEEAIALAKKNQYDVILMDQRMPVMDGTHTLHEIRNLKNCPNENTPVICLTADAVSGAKEKYMEQGFTDYLTKPVDGISLENALLEYLPGYRILTDADDPAAIPAAEESRQEYEIFTSLGKAGVDTAVGLKHCNGSSGFYLSVLEEFCHEAGHKSLALQEYYEKEDWKNYGITVHSLKSTSRMIGAAAVSEMAAKLEAAAVSGDAAIIRDGHPSMMSSYTTLYRTIDGIIGTGNRQIGENDNEILEFEPVGD